MKALEATGDEGLSLAAEVSVPSPDVIDRTTEPRNHCAGLPRDA